MPQQFNPVITKAAKTAQKRYGQQMAPMRDMIAKALRSSMILSAPSPQLVVVVKRLTPQERLVVAGLEQRLIRAAARPAPARSPFSRRPSGSHGHLRTEGDKHRGRHPLAGPCHARHPFCATEVY
jgi:hypothetical protein